MTREKPYSTQWNEGSGNPLLLYSHIFKCEVIKFPPLEDDDEQGKSVQAEGPMTSVPCMELVVPMHGMIPANISSLHPL